MRYILFLLILCCLSCKKKEEQYPSVTVQCAEIGVMPWFKGYSGIDSVVVITYKDNDSFNKLVNIQTVAVEDQKGDAYLKSGNDYRVIVPNVDTFSITAFVNTPTEEVQTGRRAGYFSCFYSNKAVVVDGDSLVPSGGGQYYSLIFLEKK